VTTLRDHAAMASADELARLIHVVDSEAAEAIEIFKQDPDGIFAIIMNAERGEKP
jgi:histidinol dehydrogenase